jgi:hypothetical protein
VVYRLLNELCRFDFFRSYVPFCDINLNIGSFLKFICKRTEWRNLSKCVVQFGLMDDGYRSEWPKKGSDKWRGIVFCFVGNFEFLS